MNRDNKAGPDFLGIGAARSGTTWIAKQLEECQEVWLPRRKELHYFSRGQNYPSPSYLEDQSWLNRVLGLEVRNRVYKKKLASAVAGSLASGDFKRLIWELKYFFGDCSIEWYMSLFPDNASIAGEITPAYALLDDQVIKEIVSMNPDIKIIYIIRNPVERAWSTIKYHAKRGKKYLMEYNEEQIIQYLSQPNVVERSNYIAVIKKWLRYIPERQFLLLFYDDIITRPQYVTDQLYQFLGIKKEKKVENLVAKINKSFDMEMPKLVKKHLCETYFSSIGELEELVGGAASDWLEYVKTNRI